MTVQNNPGSIPDNILSLLAKKAANNLKDTELDELDKWLQDNPNFHEEAEEFVNHFRKMQLISLMDKFPAGEKTDFLKSHMAETLKSRNVFMRLVAFAAVIILLAAVGWALVYFSNSGSSNQDQIMISQTERHNKAVLILSNGEQFTLDNPEKTIVEEKGGISISNKPGEILAYEEDEKGAGPAMTNSLIVPAGARYQVQLSDGTKVWMNSVSRLDYPVSFEEDKRVVTLSGEAFFDVKEDPGRPFIIRSNGYEINVLGTTFNVSTYEDDSHMETVLVSGKVELTDKNGITTQMKPGDMVRINNGSQETTVQQVDSRFYTSWKDGILHFNKVSLEDLMVKLERWYDVNIEFADPQAKELVYSGAMENSKNIRFLLDLLEQTADVEFEVTETNITIK